MVTVKAQEYMPPKWDKTAVPISTHVRGMDEASFRQKQQSTFLYFYTEYQPTKILFNVISHKKLKNTYFTRNC